MMSPTDYDEHFDLDRPVDELSSGEVKKEIEQLHELRVNLQKVDRLIEERLEELKGATNR